MRGIRLTTHQPILPEAISEALLEPFRRLRETEPPHWVVDCTLGGGGHTARLLEALRSEPGLVRHRVLSVDQDPAAVEAARARFQADLEAGRLELLRVPFGDLGGEVRNRPVLGLLADLGFSSDQLEDPARGLSFSREGPLDMRLNPESALTCEALLARLPEKELERILSELGEERYSRRIASALVNARRERRLPQSTTELADLVRRAVPPAARHGRIHPATRSFQALRIAVNGELEQLEQLLGDVILGLKTGGRVAVLSFHSLEDRKVKRAFQSSDSFRALTKKPFEPSEEEIRANPRARSAKLRIAERRPPGDSA